MFVQKPHSSLTCDTHLRVDNLILSPLVSLVVRCRALMRAHGSFDILSGMRNSQIYIYAIR